MLYDNRHGDPTWSISEIIRNREVREILEKEAPVIAQFKKHIHFVKTYIEEKSITTIGVEYTPEMWTKLATGAQEILTAYNQAMYSSGYNQHQTDDLLLLLNGPVFYLYATGYEPFRSGKVKIVGFESEKINSAGLKLASDWSDLNDELFADISLESRSAQLYIQAILSIKENRSLAEEKRNQLIASFPLTQQLKVARSIDLLQMFEKNKMERDRFLVEQLGKILTNDALVIRGRDHQKYIDTFSQQAQGINFETIDNSLQ